LPHQLSTLQITSIDASVTDDEIQIQMVSAWVSSRELGALLVRTPSTLSIHSSFQVNFSKK